MKAPHRDVVPLFQTKWGAWLSQPARTSWTKPNLRDSSFYSYLSFSTLPSHYVSQSFIYCHIRSRQQIASGSFFKSSASKPRHYFVLHTHLLCRIQFIFYVASNSSSMSHPIHLLCRIQFIFYVALISYVTLVCLHFFLHCEQPAMSCFSILEFQRFAVHTPLEHVARWVFTQSGVPRDLNERTAAECLVLRTSAHRTGHSSGQHTWPLRPEIRQ
jgi:hypothetical protein